MALSDKCVYLLARDMARFHSTPADWHQNIEKMMPAARRQLNAMPNTELVDLIGHALEYE